jgi:hypothetical protein
MGPRSDLIGLVSSGVLIDLLWFGAAQDFLAPKFGPVSTGVSLPVQSGHVCHLPRPTVAA